MVEVVSVPLEKAVLFVIDGMDTVNFTMGYAPVLGGIHGKTAVGIAHTEVLGAGAAITPIAHAMMGTGAVVVAHRPGEETVGRSFDYFGRTVETIGHVAKEAGMTIAAVGKNEAAIVLGGTDLLDISRLEKDGVNASDDKAVAGEILKIIESMGRGILVANYGQVDLSGHKRDVAGVIRAVQKADGIVSQIMARVDLSRTLVVIAADHGTNPITGDHNTAPTPLCLITDKIKGRVNMGVVHNLEIALTITSALGLRPPQQAVGRELLSLAVADHPDLNYLPQVLRQLDEIYRKESPRHQTGVGEVGA